jgi:hypothetical protein
MFEKTLQDLVKGKSSLVVLCLAFSFVVVVVVVIIAVAALSCVVL